MKRKLALVLMLVLMLLMIMPFEALAQEIVDDSAASSQSSPLYRRSFYAEGRYWEFYSYGTSTYFKSKSSTGGATWSSRTLVASGGDHQTTVDIAYDGTTYIHVAVNRDGWAGYIYYDRGNPNSDGTITWSSGTTTPNWQYVKAYCGGYNSSSSVTICLDGNGYPYIGYTGSGLAV